jgi:recombination endonuclease VII
MPVKGQRQSRLCRVCGETNPTKFQFRYATLCAECRKSAYPYDAATHRQYKLKSKYNITLDQYAAKLAEQHGLCAICHQLPDVDDFICKTKQQQQYSLLVVDHDHKTGENRGLVHGRCNTLLADAREDTAILMGAIDYLRRYRKVSD